MIDDIEKTVPDDLNDNCWYLMIDDIEETVPAD